MNRLESQRGIYHSSSKIKLTSRFLFVEFETPEQATNAIKQLDGFRMDKTHTLAVNRLTDIEKYANVDDEYVEPEFDDYSDREHLRSWLADPQGRDQWVIYRNEDVHIMWNRKNENPEVVYHRPNWTETYVQWSPLGTYLATFHRQGIALWGGPTWKQLIKFPHMGVKLIDFSPNERYLVTWSNEPLVYSAEDAARGSPFGPEDDGNSIVIWDARSGELQRTFPSPIAEDGRQLKIVWPMIKWSGDDKYFARVTPGQQISVYETPGMGLLDKKSIKIEGVVDFEWAPHSEKSLSKKGTPSQNIISYWTPEVANQPARVTLVAIPSKQIIRTKNLFNVSDCKLHWQSEGDYLCVKVDRHTKTKKSTFANLEIFRVREKDIPVEVIEIKDTVIAFAWEPKGERFALITSNDINLGTAGPSTTLRTAISFYYLEKVKGATGNFRLAKTIDKKTCNSIFWSPKGRHVLLATMGSTSAFDLEFWDVDFDTKEAAQGAAPASSAQQDADVGASLQLMAAGEHYGVTDVEWDPTGRYVVTSASMWRHSMENGYALWDFRGQQLQKHVLDRFKQLLWRPRPKSLLSKDDQKKVRKNLKEYSRKFDEEDLAEQSSVSRELLEHRRRLVDEWNAWRSKCEKEVEEERKALGLPGRKAAKFADEEEEEISEWIEQVIEEYEEVVE